MNAPGTVEVNEERERALHLQLAFKPGIMCDLAVGIVELALKGSGVWPDEVDFRVLKVDSACVGSTFHRMALLGILVKDRSLWRMSKAEAANGREVFFWRLVDRRLACAFLRANGRAQPELALV